jgi:hypothetical protein
MEPLSLMVGTIVLPVIAVIVNSTVRWRVSLPQSAPADVVMTFVIIDAIVVMNNKDFEGHMPSEAISQC